MKRTSDRRRKAGPREWFALALESWHPDSGLVVYPERLRPRETSGEHVLGSAAGETAGSGIPLRLPGASLRFVNLAHSRVSENV